jgi:hypothetical protein
MDPAQVAAMKAYIDRVAEAQQQQAPKSKAKKIAVMEPVRKGNYTLMLNPQAAGAGAGAGAGSGKVQGRSAASAAVHSLAHSRVPEDVLAFKQRAMFGDRVRRADPQQMFARKHRGPSAAFAKKR